MSNPVQSTAVSLLLGSTVKTTTSTSTVTTTTTTNPSGGKSTSDASDALTKLSQQVAAMRQAQQQQKIKVQDFQKTTHDVQIDNRATARNIGILRHDQSRLNVISSLGKGDKADFFSFSMAKTDQAKFAILTADGSDEGSLRFQILKQKTGAVVADSDPASGDAKGHYDQLKQGTLNLDAGTYVLRITRQDDTAKSQKTDHNYALQLSSGLYRQDFDTVEKAVDPNPNPFGYSVSTSINTLTGSLGSAVTYLQSLPKIGASATDKLNGLLLNSIF